MPAIFVNGQSHDIQASPLTPLLWLIRDVIGLKGTKYGCGVGNCGACTVLVDGAPRLSCQLMLSDVERSHIVTIEGLAPHDDHPLQLAWIEHQVPQCGFCQPGQIMRATALLGNGPPADATIDTTMNHICVCGTYSRIRAAIHTAAGG